jgi:hypothetical protein
MKKQRSSKTFEDIEKEWQARKEEERQRRWGAMALNEDGSLNFKARYVTDSEGTALVKWECPGCHHIQYETNIKSVKEHGLVTCCYHCCTTW